MKISTLSSAIACLAFLACGKKQEINLESLPQGEPARVTRYELESVSFYNIQLIEENGVDKEIITDSARIDLKELANGNIISIHSFWNDQGYSQYIEGEYEYGINGWIASITEPGSRRPILSSQNDDGTYILQNYNTGYKAFYPQTSSGKVKYYSAQVYADTTKDYVRKLNLVEMYSDSSVFQYTGSALSQFDVYYTRSDSFSVPFETEKIHHGSTSTAAQWNDFLKGNQDRKETKEGEQLMKTVFLSQAETPPNNPLFQLLAPLNFDIMEVPFLHSQQLPKMVTTNGAGGTKIRQYNYVLDQEKRPLQIRELEINSSNEKIPTRSIHFNYKK